MSIGRNIATVLLASAACLAATAPASAASVIFDFGSGGVLNTSGNPDIFTRTISGVGVTARAYNGLSVILDANKVSFASAADVTRTSAGLGVAGNGSGEINDGGFFSLGEGLLLRFDQEVELTRALFSNFDAGDSVGFEFGSPIADGETLDPLAVSAGAWNGSYFGKEFFFAANSLDGDSFRLRGVTVNAAGAVPEPATWAMMLIGFGMVGGLMRRRAKQGEPTVRFNFA